MKNSVELFARRRELATQQQQHVTDGSLDDAYRVEGMLARIDDEIAEVLADEAAFRAAAPSPDAGAHRSLAEAALGVRAQFNGIARGFSVSVSNAAVTMPGLESRDYSLPDITQNAYYTFIDTLPTSKSDAGTIKYMRGKSVTGEPATWTKGTKKAEVLMSWDEATAIEEIIAGIVPVSEISLADYGQLAALINGELLRAYRRVLDRKVLTGNNTNGIVGVLNTVGIQQHTALAKTPTAVEVFDNIRKMRTKVTKETGMVPNCVAMTPEILEVLDLHKTTDNLYQFGLGVSPWGMQVVEDVNIGGVLVYTNTEAEVVNIGADSEIKVGTVGDQFAFNELSIRLEGRKALKVVKPEAFVYAKQATV